ncbi:hypothetical protein SAMD00019534_055460 [Acytostelium subglobosum LB1]|uniref:hypothetical protein n=1 Tax=Acytostelium subglobosum LB1 TaxID=1410327 RepID=UPI00064519FD|nr:hypothetical protein SAMD00019534_055460 [Acytostelium subglobosum LB1]GAM22371.1 hypothetical protein SAMD00019534_055460 [Acytostelium subglobosum LB1]|eukprot:XP_012754491.1 hypothetical protein SAMD00019534_055460 [Acytostelium subglobosum LB1]
MNFFRKLLDIPEVKSTDEVREREELGITDELVLYVKNISKYPESFKDFPIHTLSKTPFTMSSLQQRHVKKIITIVDTLDTLRFQLCPSLMKDDMFWRIYFLHISKVATQDFDAISKKTPLSPLDELDMKLEEAARAPKVIQFDQGIDDDEDNYWSENTYLSLRIKEIESKIQDKDNDVAKVPIIIDDKNKKNNNNNSNNINIKSNAEESDNKPIIIQGNSGDLLHTDIPRSER